MHLLFISNLFPNQRQPGRGLFNAQQVHALARLCPITVIAPTEFAAADETRDGVTVHHPRFRHVPLLSRPFNGWLYARAIEPALRAASFDIALASFAYPDAYGVMLLARRYGFPFATAALGSDVNLLFRHPQRKRQVLQALQASRVVFAKSDALKTTLATAGIHSALDLNGIDHERFCLRDRAAARAQLGLAGDRRFILYVGNLVPVKGPRVLAAAFARLADLPGLELVVLGDGPQARLFRHAPRVRLLGRRPHDEIARWMNAADLLCLPSLQEGLPNVALEALASGLPVVGSRTGGVPEVVTDGQNGLLVPPGDPGALAAALRAGLQRPWNPAAISATAASFDWDLNARILRDALLGVLASNR